MVERQDGYDVDRQVGIECDTILYWVIGLLPRFMFSCLVYVHGDIST